MTTSAETASVNLYWLPLGAGDGTGCVRTNGRVYEALVARRQHRPPCRLYHAALEVRLGDERFTIEMAPVWSLRTAERGVVAEGPVGLRWLGRSRLFRYEVRRWRDGLVPDLAEAVGGARRLSSDPARAALLLALVPEFPTVTWGRDELGTGDMWNSNSLVSWLLALSGHDTDAVLPPAGGRAPGWRAGLVVAAGRSERGLDKLDHPRALGQERRDRSPSRMGRSALPTRWRDS
jgi:hypothetical protein